MCVLTNRNNNRKKCFPLPKWVAGEVSGSGGGGTSREVMGLMWLLAAVLVCAGTLVMHVRAGPIYAAVGTCPNFCLGVVLNADEHGFLYSPGLTVNLFMHNIKLVGSKGCPEVAL